MVAHERRSLSGWWRDLVAGRTSVAFEVDAFLDGSYLEHVLAGGGVLRTEPWMWLNAPAHARIERVRELAGGEVTRTDRDLRWFEVRTLVARHLMACCGDDEGVLGLLQSTALVPLELAVMAEHGTSPMRLMAEVLAELPGPNP